MLFDIISEMISCHRQPDSNWERARMVSQLLVATEFISANSEESIRKRHVQFMETYTALELSSYELSSYILRSRRVMNLRYVIKNLLC